MRRMRAVEQSWCSGNFSKMWQTSYLYEKRKSRVPEEEQTPSVHERVSTFRASEAQAAATGWRLATSNVA